ncbi:MAG: hypothetical protein V3U80_10355 [Flavobacteriaceae bacterium]
MNTEEFIKLTINPNSIQENQLPELEQIVTIFPFFQAAQVIYLKGLKNQKSFKYNTVLKQVASHTNNRTVLFDFITAHVFDYNKHSIEEAQLLDEIEVIDSNVIDHLYQSIIASDVNSKETENHTQIKSNEADLNIGLPLNFDKNDAFSFNEWLKLTPQKPIDRSKKNKKRTNPMNDLESNLSEKLNLLQNFKLKRPQLKPTKPHINIDVSKESTTENVSLMTETLARVYLEQKKYKKSIAAFKILCLKYPEKSSFFANQIKEIKKIKK